MTVKKTISVVADIKKLLDSKKMIIGTRQAIKSLKRGELELIYVSANCPEAVKEDIDHYSSLAGTNVIRMEQANDEIGAICKKGFSISVIGVLK